MNFAAHDPDEDEPDIQPEAMTLDAPIYDMVELSQQPGDTEYYAVEEKD